MEGSSDTGIRHKDWIDDLSSDIRWEEILMCGT